MENITRNPEPALAGFSGRLCWDEPLARHTTFGIGGPAQLLAYPRSVADLHCLLAFARTGNLPWFVIGAGSNLLIDDAGFAGLVISLADGFTALTRAGDRLRAGAGAGLNALVDYAVAEACAGLEFLAGIPGTVGGAVQGNAGAYGQGIGDRVAIVEVVGSDGTVGNRTRVELGFGYRQSNLTADTIVTAVEFTVAPGIPAALAARVAAIRDERRQRHPPEPSAGCIFKNPPGMSAGRLIDAAGGKNRRVGDALVSPRHANFIVNVGRATFADVRTLIEDLRALVARHAGVRLENEIWIIEANLRPARAAAAEGGEDHGTAR